MDRQPTDPQVLTVVEAARRLRVTVETARAQAACGELPAAQFGRQWRFYWPALLAHLHYAPEPGQTGAALSAERAGEVIDLAEVAHRLGISVETARAAIIAKTLPAGRVGGQWRIVWGAVVQALGYPERRRTSRVDEEKTEESSEGKPGEG